MGNFFTSSVGKKLLMSLAGIFLLSFLIVHLGINLLVILFDSRQYFNIAAHFMGTNLLIKIFEIILFGGFFIHMIYGVIVSIQNWIARPKGYKKANYSQTSFFSKYMFHTAVVLIIFLVIHLTDFYVKSKFMEGSVAEVIYNGKQYHDLGALVIEKFKITAYSIFYVFALLFLGFHLHHGFQSAFQTLGINHQTYTPIIKTFGLVYTLVVTAGFIAIPVVVYFFK